MPRIRGSQRHAKTLIYLLPIILIALALGACETDEPGSGQARAEGGGAADSSVVPDSVAVAAADSSEADEAGGFFARFRRGHNDEADEDEVEPIPVELATVILRDVPSYLSSTASLEPDRQVEIQVKTGGQIDRIYVEEGDFVKKEQVLALLDGEIQRASMREAAIRADKLERDFKRGEALYTQQGISEKEFAEIRFQHEQAQAQLAAAQLEVDRCEVKAPFSGYIAERVMDVGQTMATGARLFSIVDVDPLLARIFLPEKEAVHIAPGQNVVITPDTHPGLELQGEVLRLSPIVDRRTGTVKVTCRISQVATLRPGSFVRVKVQTDIHPQVRVIPKRALLPEGGEIYVFKAVADSVIKVAIKTGYSSGDLVEVTEGLALGEQVVSVGSGSLKMGSKIRVLNEIEIEQREALADSTPMGEI